MQYKKIYEIVYSGQGFSLNDFYSQGHWTQRNKIKNEFGYKFHNLIDKYNVEPFNKYELEFVYNSRHDVTNTIGMIKVFEDTLTGGRNKKNGTNKYPILLQDDSPDHCKEITMRCDKKTQKPNTFKFILKVIE